MQAKTSSASRGVNGLMIVRAERIVMPDMSNLCIMLCQSALPIGAAYSSTPAKKQLSPPQNLRSLLL
jgi:hypothetical protein